MREPKPENGFLWRNLKQPNCDATRNVLRMIKNLIIQKLLLIRYIHSYMCKYAAKRVIRQQWEDYVINS